MDRVEEIEAAITSLPDEDYRRLAAWFLDREQARWDEQMDWDSTAGRPDFLFQEADDETSQGVVRAWPPK
jgi:hypothetical protein